MTAELEQFAEVAPGLRSSLPEAERAAGYDRLALGYDLLVGNPLYNRLVWGCPKSAYRGAAGGLLADVPAGELIDFGCGSLVFTAASYRGCEDRLVLFDRSLGMLRRGRERLPRGRFLQGDAFAAPFDDGTFAGAMGWGMLHVFGTGSGYLAALHRLVRHGAPVAIGTLVLTDRAIGNRMLAMLHARGEAAAPEGRDSVERAFATLFAIQHARLAGNMLFLQGRKRG
ncbi:MAG: class I SAM-dependent methyltransferase [Sphingomonadales bacterium]|nr:class I SAM-dependent methyltransferase [Sphingomonadales bacterium]MBD3772991.1 class I SAM-dependent methyltransferase [Paracoccaceae bacterium]MBD3813909.1 class I SAM-dependent methyltransferase [Betaproteobacteria bacterium]